MAFVWGLMVGAAVGFFLAALCRAGVLMDNASFIWKWLWERTENDYGVAGLVGNLCAESGLQADNLHNSYKQLLKMSD